MIDPDRHIVWRSLPACAGAVWAGMVREVLEERGIPTIVKTNFLFGVFGIVSGTNQLGSNYLIEVPEEDYEAALEIYKMLLGDSEAEGGIEEAPQED